MGSGSGNEPRIHSNAVATHAATRLKHVHPGVVVGQADQLTHVDAKVITHQREFVGKGDVHIAEAVLGELHQFSGTGRGNQQFTLAEAGVEDLSGGSGSGVRPPITRSLLISSWRMRPGSTRSGQ